MKTASTRCDCCGKVTAVLTPIQTPTHPSEPANYWVCDDCIEAAKRLPNVGIKKA